MKPITKLVVSIAVSCFSSLTLSQEYQPVAADMLPIPGKWSGDQQCMTLGRENAMPASRVTMTVRENELVSEYAATGRANSKFVKADPAAGLTPETPDFIRSLTAGSIISDVGKTQFEQLAAILEGAGEVSSYSMLPSDNVVEGQMICQADDQWCHFQATLRVKFGNNAFEVKGGDMFRVYGDRMVMVGYAYDEFSCAPDTCVVVCEANLIKQ